MKKYPISKLSGVFLSLTNLHKLSLFATSKVGRDVRVFSDPGNTCYSCNDWSSGTCIKLGKLFYETAFQDNEDVPETIVRDKYKSIAKVLLGAFYHELFHLLYTPFGYSKKLLSRFDSDTAHFIHTICNILEDATIEPTGCSHYPYAQQYIDAITECFNLPEPIEHLKYAITNEPENPGTFYAYLLHYCRDINLSHLPKYSLWEDNKDFIVPAIHKCLNTIGHELRVRRQIAFALQIIKILDHKKPDMNDVDNPPGDFSDEADETESSKAVHSTHGGSVGSGNSSIKPLNQLTDTSSKGPSNLNPQETDDDISVPSELIEQKASREDAPPVSDNSQEPIRSDLTKEGITMLANDDPSYRYSHFFDRLNKYVNTSKYLPQYNNIVSKLETIIRKFVGIFRKAKAINNTSWNHYQLSGSLDMSTVYKKGNYKIFKKKNAPKEEANLVFSILVDNSGSMHGTKAKLAGYALILFCETLNRLKIPFEVNAFTEGGQAITIGLKDFNESYDKVKTNMTLFTEQFDVNQLSTWYSNIDEINLRFVADRFSTRLEKDKVLVVISDGATCGDWKTLKHVAETIEASGTMVLGIGIFDSNVEKIYSKNIVLHTKEDLENLGTFLNKFLISKMFK